jgi:glyoxylase-like metal-dependent hydrolase (beta-lactamase superfamily II)
MAANQSRDLYSSRPLPALDIPSGASVKVQIIDTTSRITVPASAFMEPVVGEFEAIQGVPAFHFLVEQLSSGRKVLFDLGLRKDWQNLPPPVPSLADTPGWGFQSDKNVADILQDNGVDVAGGAIETVFWSHWHFDHTGDVDSFPKSTILTSGPGVKETFLPGYPTNPASPLLESDFAGREHREIDFSDASTVQIGPFRGVDYFGDGSFYLLDVPGHAIGHISALARVTSTREGDAEDTFIFMGGDTAHHGGEFRPSEYLPLPREIRPSPDQLRHARCCPGHVFEAMHPRQRGNVPFYQVSAGPFCHDAEVASQSIAKMQQFDASPNVFVVVAHDPTLLDADVGIPFFPHGTMNDWKAQGYSSQVHWAFLKDFVPAGEVEKT